MMPVKLSWSNMSAVQPAGELGEFGFFLRTWSYFEDDFLKKTKKKKGFISLHSSLPPSLLLRSRLSFWLRHLSRL